MRSPSSYDVIWLVEARGLDGAWRPYQVPKKPFSKGDAVKLRVAAAKRHRRYKFRVRAYEPAGVLISGPRNTEDRDDGSGQDD